MPDCSLCGGPMGDDGGAVLFTDTRGIPFEVCCECEKRFDTLRASRSQPDTEAALDYISKFADGIAYRGAYDELMGYVGKEFPIAELEAEIAGIRDAKRREIEERKPGAVNRPGMTVRRLLFMIVGAVLLAALLFMVYRWT